MVELDHKTRRHGLRSSHFDWCDLRSPIVRAGPALALASWRSTWKLDRIRSSHVHLRRILAESCRSTASRGIPDRASILRYQRH